jgi:hypothetical protein
VTQVSASQRHEPNGWRKMSFRTDIIHPSPRSFLRLFLNSFKIKLRLSLLKTQFAWTRDSISIVAESEGDFFVLLSPVSDARTMA